MLTLNEVKAVLEEQVVKQEEKINQLRDKISHLDHWGPMWWDRQEASEHAHWTRDVRHHELIIDNIKNAIDDLQMFKKNYCVFDIEVRKKERIVEYKHIDDEPYYETITDKTRILVIYNNKNGYSHGFEQELCDDYDWIK